MLGIHTVYTPVNRIGTAKIHDMMQFESLTMILSALCWKKYQGPIKLYCDKDFYEYINLLGVTDLWDEIDTQTLSELDPNVNHDLFWAYSKMYVNSLQTEPFVSLDIDLFQLQEYDYTTHDVVFSHIERTNEGLDSPTNFDKIIFYPDYHKLDMFKDRFEPFSDIEITDEAMNVAILAINKPEMYKEFMKYVDSFVKGNQFNPLDITTHGFERIKMMFHSSSLITFVEQRLLNAFVKSKGYTSKSVLGMIYDGGMQNWDTDSGEMSNPNITHLWGWKVSYRTPEYEQTRLELTDFLLGLLKTDFPDSYKKYIEDGKVLNYCKR
jgi:hypothetical protein